MAATLQEDVNYPESQVLVSNWEPAHSLVKDAISGAEEVIRCTPQPGKSVLNKHLVA